MSLTNSPIWFGSGATGGGFYDYEINDSLRFNDNDSAYLNRTPASAGNRTTWTWSGWVKRGNLGGTQAIFSTATTNDVIYLNVNNELVFYTTQMVTALTPLNLFRDTSAWYHFVFVWDTTNVTQADRTRIYLNGERLAVGTGAQAALNATSGFNNNVVHGIGYAPYVGSYYLDGYLSDINFIDGQALDPTSFGETKSGVWIPKAYGGSYGTNGFHLDFSDNSTATNLGLDSSGNSNNFSVNNIATTDQMIDTPTNNFATLTPLVVSSSITLAEGNLKATTTSTSASHQAYSAMNIPTSGKWYFECYAILPRADDLEFGISEIPSPDDRNANHLTTMLYDASPDACAILNTLANNLLIRQQGGSATLASGISGSTGDIYQIAFDCDTGKVFLGRNNTYYRVGAADGDPASGTNPSKTITANKEYCIGLSCYGGNGAGGGIINYGQDSTFAGNTTAGGNSDANGVGDFKYSVPSGYLALCSANLSEPVVGPLGNSLSDENFNTVLYTGNGSSRSITGVGFQPDWVWGKARNHGYSHWLYDSVRGAEKIIRSDLTSAEGTQSQGLTAFNADGFSLGTTDDHNENTKTFVAWNWKAGGTAVSNTDGSITSQVSANVDAGFSIVSYTGNATTNATIGHGLGVAPDFIIHKNRSVVDDWSVWSSALPNTTGYKLILNLTSAQQTTSNYPTLPTSSVFYVGAGQEVNGNTHNMIAYCFANTEGYLKAGSYTGNGSADGAFVYTGFRPAWLMVKNASVANSWRLWDSERPGYNLTNLYLTPDNTGQEGAINIDVDFTSNGFKLRGSNSSINGSGNTIIYLAFAENPFKYANAR